MADVSLRDLNKRPVVQPLRLPTIRALWARWVDARRRGLRFPLLAAVVSQERLAVTNSATRVLGAPRKLR